MDPLICEQETAVRREKANNFQRATLPLQLYSLKLQEMFASRSTLGTRTFVLFGKGAAIRLSGTKESSQTSGLVNSRLFKRLPEHLSVDPSEYLIQGS